MSDKRSTWIGAAADSSRFFVISLLFHVLLMMVLGIWTLPSVVDVIVSKIQEAEAGVQPFDDNQHESHEDGQQAWEKLADLQAETQTVDLVRHTIEPISIPSDVPLLKPTVSVDSSAKLDGKQVVFVAPDELPQIRQAQLTERTMARPRAAIELTDAATELIPLAPQTLERPDIPQPAELRRAEISAQVPPARELNESAGTFRPTRRMSVGEVADIANDVAPTLGPQASLLNRPRASASRVVYAADSVGMREMFTLRDGDIRKQFIELFGGTPDSESAVDNGLAWLAAHQHADGRWSLNKFHENCQGKHPNCSGAGNVQSDSAATGLALLPFAAAGHTHQSGDYQTRISAAIEWLKEKQQENGDLLAPGDQQRMYSHSIATIALCELYGMTGDAELKEVVEKSLDFIAHAQHAGTGGWRYNPNEPGDTSVVGWAMMALKSGEMAGVSVPKETLDNVARWLERVEGGKPVGGLFGYQDRKATPAMTAEGLLCLQWMATERNSPRMRAGADYLLMNLPDDKQSKTSYYWYYGTQVMYHMQGKYWEAWNEKLRNYLVDSQIKDGPLAGTWEPRDNWEKRGGRVYTTALKLLMLEVYYRHLPLYEQLGE